MSSPRQILSNIGRSISALTGPIIPYRTKFPRTAPPRILLYSSSVVGLGHLARLSRVANRLLELHPSLNILLIADKDDVSLFELAKNIAVVKLPGYTFGIDEESDFKDVPNKLQISKSKFSRLRQNVIRSIVFSYQPDIFVVETLPHGKQHELLSSITYIARFRPLCRRILFLRDIPGSPEEKYLRPSSNINQIERYHSLYHHILVSGDKNFFDLGAEYNWSEELQKKTPLCRVYCTSTSAKDTDFSEKVQTYSS